MDEVQVLSNVKLGSCILIMIWTLQLQNLQTLTLHGCVEVFALEVTKLPYNESYDTFNEISLFTGNSFKRNRVALANHLHHFGHILVISFLLQEGLESLWIQTLWLKVEFGGGWD